jgi:hypothetical protein
MYLTTPKKQDAMVLTIPSPPVRLRFVGQLRNGGGVHQDRRRRNDRAEIKARLRRGDC